MSGQIFFSILCRGCFCGHVSSLARFCFAPGNVVSNCDRRGALCRLLKGHPVQRMVRNQTQCSKIMTHLLASRASSPLTLFILFPMLALCLLSLTIKLNILCFYVKCDYIVNILDLFALFIQNKLLSILLSDLSLFLCIPEYFFITHVLWII